MHLQYMHTYILYHVYGLHLCFVFKSVAARRVAVLCNTKPMYAMYCVFVAPQCNNDDDDDDNEDDAARTLYIRT